MVMTGPDPGAEWMSRLQAGDMDAFDSIVNHYQKTVYAFLYRFRGRQDGLEDLAQEVFLRVFRARQNYRPEARFTTWLYRIACNLSMNAARDRKGAISLDGGSQDDLGDRPGNWEDARVEQPSREMEKKDVVAKVQEALEALPEKYRTAMILHRYHDMSYVEIGKVLEMSDKAVKSMMARAREILKVKLLPVLKEEVSG